MTHLASLTNLSIAEEIDSVDLSTHAEARMYQRGVSPDGVALALRFGRKIHSRGAVFHVIGKKEICRLSEKVPEIRELDGLQVVVSPAGDAVITIYKNHDLRAIRPTKRCDRHKH